MQHATFKQLSSNVVRLSAVFFLAYVQLAHAGTGMGLVPCDGAAGDECTLNSVIQLANNLMSFFFNTLLLPIVIAMIMYVGYSYIAALGKPGQHAKLGSMAMHLVLGLLLMLCAWVIVRAIISILGYHDSLYFFAN